MFAQLKKTPIAAGLGFLVACSVCLLPVLIAAIAAGGFVSAAGALSWSAWVIGAAVFVFAGAIAACVWLLLRHRDRCAPTLANDA